MGSERFNMHLVATYGEAAELIGNQRAFYLANCNCREVKGGCSRSRTDVCLHFTGGEGQTIRIRPISKADAETILSEAAAKRLVPRPFRSREDPSVIEGICFCCDDCCCYFTGGDEPCDKGNLIEITDLAPCSQCGACPEVCYFGARSMETGCLTVERGLCFGCGLCVDGATGNWSIAFHQEFKPTAPLRIVIRRGAVCYIAIIYVCLPTARSPSKIRPTPSSTTALRVARLSLTKPSAP